MSSPLVFDFYNSIIEVPIPDTTLTMQYLINQIRDTEEELVPGMSYNKIADASGKEDLGGGIYTAITVKLLDSWRIRFEARTGDEGTIQCTISGGNLVGGPGGNPVAPSAYTQVLNLSSAAGTIATPATSSENTNIKYMLAALGEKQRAVGSIFYWDPVGGSDSSSGLTPALAVKTFAKVHNDLVTSGANDIIFCLATDSTGITTVDNEVLAISKNNVKLKGPGHIFKIAPLSILTDTVNITGNNVEISGIFLSTAATGTANAVTVTGDGALIKDCWISGVMGHGVNLSSSNLSTVTSSVIEHCGTSGTGNGVNLGDTAVQTTISKCIIFDNKNGINLSGTGVNDNVIENNLIYKNSVYGVDIGGTGVVRTTLRSGNTFNKNGTGVADNIHNLGTDTYIETTGAVTAEDRALIATQVADSVWDEVIGDHTGVGSAAKVLRDTKTKATLASLK
jgi:hypothetical protein